MAEPRTVVITGASRGLGFASAVRMYREGWRVVAAMRTPDQAMPLLRAAIQKRGLPPLDDERLIGVQLDLTDSASIAAAAIDALSIRSSWTPINRSSPGGGNPCS